MGAGIYVYNSVYGVYTILDLISPSYLSSALLVSPQVNLAFKALHLLQVHGDIQTTMPPLDEHTRQTIVTRVLAARAQRSGRLAQMQERQCEELKVANKCAQILKNEFRIILHLKKQKRDYSK